MKRYGYLFETVASIENLRLAEECASRGKRSRKDVVEFEANLEANLQQLHDELMNKTYATSPYEIFKKYEPKEREIYKLPYRDRVVQWSIMLVAEPIWVATMTADTYSCLKGRGIHACLKKLQRDLRTDPEGTAYALKVDITKCYPSIDHETLKGVVRRRIKDPDMLWLLDGIIDSAPGIPIGNYLSQFFANLYLSELDHMVKERYRVRYYYRYADDIVILGRTKEELQGLLLVLNDYLMSERLMVLKGNYQVFPVDSRGIDFLGYVCYHTHTLLRKSIKQRFCRRVATLNKKELSPKDYKQQVCGWLGWSKHCDSIHLLKVLDMKKFSDVQKNSGNYVGTKVRIDDIIGTTIQLVGFTVGNSRFHDKCLTMQIKTEDTVRKEDGTEAKEWVEHVCFTGSEALMKQLDGVEIDPNDAPFCKIIKQEINAGRCFYKIVDPD